MLEILRRFFIAVEGYYESKDAFYLDQLIIYGGSIAMISVGMAFSFMMSILVVLKNIKFGLFSWLMAFSVFGVIWSGLVSYRFSPLCKCQSGRI